MVDKNRKIVIAAAVRTPVGTMGGNFKDVTNVDLGVTAVKAAIERAGIEPEDVQRVFMGCCLPGASKANVARQVTLNSGIPVDAPAVTINVLCGSGLEAVNMGARVIDFGDADVVIAGGCENMSRAPYLLSKGRFGYRLGNAQIYDHMLYDGLIDAFYDYHMGCTAENVADQYNISREEMDEFALESQKRAAKADQSGRFKDEIAPVSVPGKRGAVTVIDQDQGIRYEQTLEQLGKLKPAFWHEGKKADGNKEGREGRVTAGNASGINDGAAVVVLMTEEKAKELGVKPLAYWLGSEMGGVDPSVMGLGPIVAINRLMKKLDCDINKFDLIELNEAFAAQAIACVRDLNIDMDKCNVNGGAVALGHPVGCSGCRILVTLIHEMLKRPEAKYGLASLCVGGGMGVATAVQKYE